MTAPQPLIILGASTRAAAFSAARAGFAPYWIDRFGDADLADAFPGALIPPGDHPNGMIRLIAQAPDAPWIYTGAVENHRDVINAASKHRLLLGNDANICAAVRNPHRLAETFAKADIPFPQISNSPQFTPKDQNWIIKPFHSGAGIGIAPYAEDSKFNPNENYLQRWIDGQPVAAIFVTDTTTTNLIGVTRQLVGQSWLHAQPFSYCGSVGPLVLTTEQQAAWQHIGDTLTTNFNLRGLFGVDAIQIGDTICPIEVNPRYAASVEVLERATGIHAVALHHQAYQERLHDSAPNPIPNAVAGKAILFAPNDLQIPEGPFAPHVIQEEAASIADIPHPGSHISKAHPITTTLLTGPDEANVITRLKSCVKKLYKYLT